MASSGAGPAGTDIVTTVGDVPVVAQVGDAAATHLTVYEVMTGLPVVVDGENVTSSVPAVSGALVLVMVGADGAVPVK